MDRMLLNANNLMDGRTRRRARYASIGVSSGVSWIRSLTRCLRNHLLDRIGHDVGREMRIAHRHRDALVAERFLNRSNADTGHG